MIKQTIAALLLTTVGAVALDNQTVGSIGATSFGNTDSSYAAFESRFSSFEAGLYLEDLDELEDLDPVSVNLSGGVILLQSANFGLSVGVSANQDDLEDISSDDVAPYVAAIYDSEKVEARVSYTDESDDERASAYTEVSGRYNLTNTIGLDASVVKYEEQNEDGDDEQFSVGVSYKF